MFSTSKIQPQLHALQILHTRWRRPCVWRRTINGPNISERKAVLHIVHTVTSFSTAKSLDSFVESCGETVEGMWLAFVTKWRTVNSGNPNTLRTDQGSLFTWGRCRKLTGIEILQLRASKVEAHSSWGIGGKFDALLSVVYIKIRYNHPAALAQYSLRIADEAMNETISENGLVPSRFVFEISLGFPIIKTELLMQKGRMKDLRTAQDEMNAIVAERQILTTLACEVKPSPDRTKIWTRKFLYTKNRRRNGLDISLLIIGLEAWILFSDEIQEREKTFNAFQVKPYYHSCKEILSFKIWMSQSNQSTLFTTMLTEINQPNDPETKKFDEAIRKEIAGLLERKILKVELRSKVLEDSNVLKRRF